MTTDEIMSKIRAYGNNRQLEENASHWERDKAEAKYRCLSERLYAEIEAAIAELHRRIGEAGSVACDLIAAEGKVEDQ